MRQLITILAAGILSVLPRVTNAQAGPVAHFHKVIVSPYIKVTFVQGDQESVTINNIIVDSSKLHVEVHGGTLRLYLDGAKDLPHDKQTYDEYGDRLNHARYPNHAVN